MKEILIGDFGILAWTVFYIKVSIVALRVSRIFQKKESEIDKYMFEFKTNQLEFMEKAESFIDNTMIVLSLYYIIFK